MAILTPDIEKELKKRNSYLPIELAQKIKKLFSDCYKQPGTNVTPKEEDILDYLRGNLSVGDLLQKVYEYSAEMNQIAPQVVQNVFDRESFDRFRFDNEAEDKAIDFIVTALPNYSTDVLPNKYVIEVFKTDYVDSGTGVLQGERVGFSRNHGAEILERPEQADLFDDSSAASKEADMLRKKQKEGEYPQDYDFVVMTIQDSRNVKDSVRKSDFRTIVERLKNQMK